MKKRLAAILLQLYIVLNTPATIEANVGSGEQEGDEASEHRSDGDLWPQDRDGEDNQGRAEVHRVKHCQPDH